MAALEQINGTNVGQTFEIGEKELVLGRSDECGVVLDLPAISRRHCAVWGNTNGFYLRDLGSRNQTKLNNQPILADEMLIDGDEIQLSTIRFRFLAQDSLSQESGSWGIRPRVITIDRDDDSDEATEEKSIRRKLVKAGEKVTNDELGSGQLNDVRIVARIEVADGAGGWPVINDAPVKLNQILQLLYNTRRVTSADDVLGRSLRFLFEVFPLAQKIAVVFRTEDSDGIRVGAAVCRHQTEEVQICIPVIRTAMQKREALLYVDHWNSDKTSEAPAGQLKSILVCPLNSKSAFCSGAIQLECTTQKQGFTANDLERLTVLAHGISVLLEQVAESDHRLERRTLQTMQDSAVRLHEAFQPSKAPRIPGFQLAHGLIARRKVCADLVDYVVFEDGRVGVLMIDCTETSASATRSEALASRILSGALLETGKPSKAIAQLEYELEERSDSKIDGLQVCVLLIDPEENTLACCTAGYFSCYRLQEGQLEAIGLKAACSPPLGIGFSQYTDAVWPLQKEELIVVFSNGVQGIVDINGELLTPQQFQAELQLLIDGAPDCLPVSVCHRLREYQSSELLLDDIAFTMLTRTDEVLVSDEDAEQLLESGPTTS